MPGAVVLTSHCWGTTSLRPHGFTGNLAPGPLHKFGPLCQEASSRARKCMVSKSISTAAAPRFRSAPAATRCEWELEPEPATQCDLHCLGAERGVTLLPGAGPQRPPFERCREMAPQISHMVGSFMCCAFWRQQDAPCYVYGAKLSSARALCALPVRPSCGHRRREAGSAFCSDVTSASPPQPCTVDADGAALRTAE